MEEKSYPAVTTARSLKTTARRATSIIIDNMLASGLMLIPLVALCIGHARFDLGWPLLILPLTPLPIIYFRLFFKVWHNMPTPGEAISGIHVVQETYPLRTKGVETSYAFWQWRSFFCVLAIGIFGVCLLLSASSVIDAAAWTNIAAIAIVYVYIQLFNRIFSRPAPGMLERINERPNKAAAIINQVDYELLEVVQLARKENPPLNMRQACLKGVGTFSGIVVDCVIAYLPLGLLLYFCGDQYRDPLFWCFLPISLPLPLLIYRRVLSAIGHSHTAGQFIIGRAAVFRSSSQGFIKGLVREYFYCYILVMSMLLSIWGFFNALGACIQAGLGVLPAAIAFLTVGSFIWKPDRLDKTYIDRLFDLETVQLRGSRPCE